MLARLEPRIEAAALSPLITVDRNASTLADRANANVAVVDVPGFAVAIGGAAARERGHRS